MANYRGPRGKISRRFGEPILGCEKVLKKKNYPPGQHGQKRRRRSEYSLQQAAKQKAKYQYGYLEKQFSRIVRKAMAKKGTTGNLLVQFLELGLANVVYRLGIAPTIAAARQLVVHRHIRVNDMRVDRPSYLLQKGDRVSLSDKAQKFEVIQNSLANRVPYAWLAWDTEKQYGSVIDIPTPKAIPRQINTNSIIEFYSR